MQAIGFETVPLEEILDYITKHNQNEEMSKTISTAHMTELLFSDRYVVKKLIPLEFVFYCTIKQPKNDAQKLLGSFLPHVYGMVNDAENEQYFIAMENICPSKTCSQLEIKVGAYNFLPTHGTPKQESKLRSGFLLASIDDKYRVCMYSRRDTQGQLGEQKKIEKKDGIKQRVTPNSLILLLKPKTPEEEAKPELLKKAIEFYEASLKQLHSIFKNQLKDLGYWITAASLVFTIDYARESYDLKFLDFGCSIPCTNTDIWPDEQAEAFEAILQDLAAVKSKLLPTV